LLRLGALTPVLAAWSCSTWCSSPGGVRLSAVRMRRRPARARRAPPRSAARPCRPSETWTSRAQDVHGFTWFPGPLAAPFAGMNLPGRRWSGDEGDGARSTSCSSPAGVAKRSRPGGDRPPWRSSRRAGRAARLAVSEGRARRRGRRAPRAARHRPAVPTGGATGATPGRRGQDRPRRRRRGALLTRRRGPAPAPRRSRASFSRRKT
jgi:hypothetical protein